MSSKSYSKNFIDAQKTIYDENNYSRLVLGNGLTLIGQRMPNLRSLSIGVWVLTGSRYENIKNMGICHFIEHSVFKGTKKRNALQIAKSLENVGGSINAFTSKEHTCYYANTLSEDLPIAVDVLSDLVKNAVFSSKEIEREKQVIIEEIKDTDDTPEEFIQDYFYQKVFENHPLGYNILGTQSNVSGFKRGELIDFYETYYQPKNMLVSVVGNYDWKILCELINKKFSFKRKKQNRAHWPNGFAKIGKINNQPLTDYVEKGISQAHVCLGATIDVAYNEDVRFKYLILNVILGGGMSSRLFQKVREKHGLAYSIYSFVDFLYDCGLFGVYYATEKEKIDKSLSLVQTELNNLVKNPIKAGELKMAKAQIKANLLFGLESTSTRMMRLAKNEIYLGKKVNITDVTKLIEKITLEDIRSTARNFVDRLKNLKIVLVK